MGNRAIGQNMNVKCKKGLDQKSWEKEKISNHQEPCGIVSLFQAVQTAEYYRKQGNQFDIFITEPLMINKNAGNKKNSSYSNYQQ